MLPTGNNNQFPPPRPNPHQGPIIGLPSPARRTFGEAGLINSLQRYHQLFASFDMLVYGRGILLRYFVRCAGDCARRADDTLAPVKRVEIRYKQRLICTVAFVLGRASSALMSEWTQTTRVKGNIHKSRVVHKQ